MIDSSNMINEIYIRFATTSGRVLDQYDKNYLNLKSIKHIDKYPLGSCVTIEGAIYIIDRSDYQIISQLEINVIIKAIVWMIKNMYNDKSIDEKHIIVILPNMTKSMLEEASVQHNLLLALQKCNKYNTLLVI